MLNLSMAQKKFLKNNDLVAKPIEGKGRCQTRLPDLERGRFLVLHPVFMPTSPSTTIRSVVSPRGQVDRFGVEEDGQSIEQQR